MDAQNMLLLKSQGKHEAKVATIHENSDWVYAKAREVDLEREMQMAKDLDALMRHFRQMYKFVGVSSNNIYWTGTPTPIRQILIPDDGFQYLTLLNPEIITMEGKDIQCIEGCGSIPGEIYVVKRKSYVMISGYTLEKQYIKISYGLKNFTPREEIMFGSYNSKAWIVQHEMDHIEGITIKERGTKVSIQQVLQI